MPQKWQELWEMLPNKKQVGEGREPSLPLILAAWWDTPAISKMMRLDEHIRYAEAHGALKNIETFLLNLKEEDWAHLGDF